MMVNIQGLTYWSFINILLANHRSVYEEMYSRVLDSIRDTVHEEPSPDDLKNGMYGALLKHDLFLEHCKHNQNRYKANWADLCARDFAEYLVSIFYKQP